MLVFTFPYLVQTILRCLSKYLLLRNLNITNENRQVYQSISIRSSGKLDKYLSFKIK